MFIAAVPTKETSPVRAACSALTFLCKSWIIKAPSRKGGIPVVNHFNDLLLQTLKEINVRLDRLDGRIDYLIDTKADKTALNATNEKLDALSAKIDTKADKADLDVTNQKIDALGHRIERIEGGIGTLKWVIGTEVAVIGVILVFIVVI